MNKILYILLLSTSISVAQNNKGIGINTTIPVATLDVNGTLGITNLPESNSSEDLILVIDKDGYIKSKLTQEVGIFRGQLNANFDSGTGTLIYKIENFDVIQNPDNSFNINNSEFTAPVSGLYRVIMSYNLYSIMNQITADNSVIGIVNENDNWVLRFSVLRNLILNSRGTSFFNIGVLNLNKGDKIYFGLSPESRLTAKIYNNNATYFEITLIKSEQ